MELLRQLAPPLRFARLVWHIYAAVLAQLEALRERKARATAILTVKLYDWLRTAVNSAIEVKFTGDPINPAETGLLICNHQSLLDYLIMAGQGPHLVADGTSVFFYVQHRLLRFPAFRSIHSGSYMVASQKSKMPEGPKMIILFPEQEPWNEARFLQHRLECEYAAAPQLNYLLYPRFDSFVEAVDLIRLERGVTHIYDATVTYHGTNKVVIHVEMHPLSCLPTKRRKLERWLEKRWYQKDRQLAECVL